jgi:lipoprotein-anchoring transpeptidase ErfK/SrfK
MVTLPKTRAGFPAAVAALLVLVCAFCVFAGPAGAGDPVDLNVSATPAVVAYPGTAHITGSIHGAGVPLAGASLTLLERPAGAVDWAATGRVATAGADGAFRFDVVPSVSTDYRVEFAGDGAHAAAQADVHVGLSPHVTFADPADPWLGDTATLRGFVAPVRPGATVTIERRVEAGWQPILSGTLDSGSRYAIPWTPSESGRYRLRARIAADAAHEAAASPSRRVVVNRPNAHDVPLQYPHYIVIVRHEYKLYYYEHGVLVRAFTVALGRPGYRTPLGYFHIYAKRRPAGGALGACAMYYRHQGAIAIHGTNEPWLLSRPVPRDFSHGCARMHNREALWLYARVPVGTKVHNLR